MLLPSFGARENKKMQLVRFGGLDLRAKAPAGTLSQCENMSADAYPALTPRKPRRLVTAADGIAALAAPEYTELPLTAFTGVRNRHFYYQGTRVSDAELLPGEKSIADFNGKLCILPDKLYYDYRPDPDTGETAAGLQSMEKALTLSGVTFYASHSTLTGAYTAYLSKSGGGFDQFQPGESLVISGCAKKENNTCRLQGRGDFASSAAIVSAVVESATASRLDLLLYTKRGERALFSNGTEQGPVTVKVSIPDMDHICVHNNRLWGTARNGEYLYASKLGDCLNFNSFQGLGDDSWYGMVGTPGGFTGICSYRSAVAAFKRDCIHHIYGDGPQNYSIPKQTVGGCLDGRSIAELGGVLYFLSAAGFQAYAGGEPYCVSPQLDTPYISCAAGTDGRRYYAAAYRPDGICDVLAFDPEHGVWHREDDTPYLGFIRHAGRLYAASGQGVWEFGAGEAAFDWSFTTQRLTYDTMEHKGLACVWIRLDAEPGTRILTEVSLDGKPFAACAPPSLGRGFGTCRIPARFGPCDSFRLRISGRGRAVVHDMELITHQGGKTYGI